MAIEVNRRYLSSRGAIRANPHNEDTPDGGIDALSD
jgi:hypothetical protein